MWRQELHCEPIYYELRVVPNDIDPHFHWIPIWAWFLHVGSSWPCTVIGPNTIAFFSIPKKGTENRLVRIFCFYDEELRWLDVSRCARHHPSHVSRTRTYLAVGPRYREYPMSVSSPFDRRFCPYHRRFWPWWPSNPPEVTIKCATAKSCKYGLQIV